jgi:hypothetical protein
LHWPRNTDPLQDIAVQRCILILLGLIYVPLAVSGAVVLSMGPPLVTVGFGLSEQLFGRDFSLRHDGGEGGREKSGK